MKKSIIPTLIIISSFIDFAVGIGLAKSNNKNVESEIKSLEIVPPNSYKNGLS